MSVLASGVTGRSVAVKTVFWRYREPFFFGGWVYASLSTYPPIIADCKGLVMFSYLSLSLLLFLLSASIFFDLLIL